MNKKTRSNIYKTQSLEYDELISKEDYKRNILKTILKIADIKNKIVIDSGAGTGRLCETVFPYAKRVFGFDISEEMLDTARKKFSKSQLKKIVFKKCDHRNMDLPDKTADLIMSGWSVCHLVKWNWKNRIKELDNVLKEFERLLKKNGTIIIFETLGTGTAEPVPPTDKLAEYYESLEKRFGFKKKIISTDYLFDDKNQCERLVSFFFGQETVSKIFNKKIVKFKKEKVRVPEFTGVWHKTI
ncbi:MAG TPA: class I SAM-dependent methyltransferase [bacterium]|nr:class I SAM-dependent methyltransferase [bacterium]HPN32224.1 class I SAM-dependent methyltransferase [bacterium]